MASIRFCSILFTLSAISLLGVAQLHAAPVSLANPTAILSQTSPSLLVDKLLDGSINTNDGWGNNISGNNTAVFETVTDLFSSPTYQGGLLTFEIHSGGFTHHELGRFRLSATTEDRSTFADGLANGGDVTTNWVVLTPLTFETDNVNVGGTTLTLQGDMSLLASGTPNEFETYTVTVQTSLTDITGFRLEAISDPSLPAGLPGRGDNGNFVVQEFSVDAVGFLTPPAPEPSTAALFGLGALILLRRRRRK